MKSQDVSEEEKFLVNHLGNFEEEPYQIIQSYFEGKHLERLVRHQLESYNHFINYQIQRTIQMFNPVVIRSENDFVTDKNKYFLEIFISFGNFKLYPPQIHENNGATKIMFPQEAKLRNFTYASTMTIDLNIKYSIYNTEKMENPKIIEKTLPKINIGKLPIMLKSSICVLSQNKHIDPRNMGECPMDCGGYFIIKGSEKTVLGQERAPENKVNCFDGKNTTKWNWYAEIKSVPDFKCISPKQIEVMISSKNNGFGNGIYVSIPRIKQPIELFVLYRALGVLTDKAICEYIVLDLEDEKNKKLVKLLQASIIDASKYMTQEDSLRHITSSAVYTPMNMDKETGSKKKYHFAMEVLNNDIFPHCKTEKQKIELQPYKLVKVNKNSFKKFLNIAEYNPVIFEKTNIKLVCSTLSVFYFRIPDFRKDLSREIDIIEEYTRFIGYKNFKEILPEYLDKKNNKDLFEIISN
jgi:DNA-directed RNA polymerase II subunit RPB2